jgi:hypothetical protein
MTPRKRAAKEIFVKLRPLSEGECDFFQLPADAAKTPPQRSAWANPGETSTLYLDLALAASPGSRLRLFYIRQADRVETLKRGRRARKGSVCSYVDYALLQRMKELARATGETKARTLARLVLDRAIAAGEVCKKAPPWHATTIGRLADYWRKGDWNKGPWSAL